MTGDLLGKFSLEIWLRETAESSELNGKVVSSLEESSRTGEKALKRAYTNQKRIKVNKVSLRTDLRVSTWNVLETNEEENKVGIIFLLLDRSSMASIRGRNQPFLVS